VQINIWNRLTGGGSNLNYYAGYLMDGWRISRRITRIWPAVDRSVTFVPASIKPEGPFGPAATFLGSRLGNGQISPRGGVAIDITGDSKTSLK
jgi:hypothetical protein